MEKKRTLVIVDFQFDFYDKAGSLYVNGAEDALPRITEAIKSGKYDKVIATLDWHGMDDESFEVNGGQWPIHCVQQSVGAGIHQDIIKAVYDAAKTMDSIELHYFTKGSNPKVEEYGAFGYCGDGGWASDIYAEDAAGISEICLPRDTEYDICGLAGDYCVWETYKIMRNYGLNVTPMYTGMAFIGEEFDYEGRYAAENEEDKKDDNCENLKKV